LLGVIEGAIEGLLLGGIEGAIEGKEVLKMEG